MITLHFTVPNKEVGDTSEALNILGKSYVTRLLGEETTFDVVCENDADLSEVRRVLMLG